MNWFPTLRRSSHRFAAVVVAMSVAWLLFYSGVALADKDNSAQQDSQSVGELVPLPEQATFLTLPLRHAQAKDVAGVLHKVLGREARVAADERLNRLIVLLPDSGTSEMVEEMVQTLDVPSDGTKQDEQGREQNLQLRVLWLADGLPDEVGTEPNAHDVSPAVIDALHDLGLAHPRIVGRNVTTLASPRGWSSEFAFKIPVNLADSQIIFEGKGSVNSGEKGGMWSRMYGIGKDQYHISLDIKITNPRKENCQMSGSLVTPLDHYVVLGTTSFVPDRQVGASGYPSAFVVYFQEAPLAPQ